MEQSANRDNKDPQSTDLGISPEEELSFHDVLKNSYAPRKTQINAFKNKGYVFDSDLSNDNEQVYYNPQHKKLLYSIAGTHNLSDVGTDLYLALGNLKGTNRYKEAQKVLEKAKKRYGVDSATISAHSLGGSIAQYIGGRKDKVFTLDKGATIGQKTRKNENAYRTSGDLVSLLNANSKHMKTLKSPKGIYSPLKAHDVGNIKHEKIYL